MKIAAFVAACAFALPVHASQLVDALRAGQSQTLVAYGTSETQYGAWVSLLGNDLWQRWPGRINVINSGAAGQNSVYGLEHLQDRVMVYQPDTVLIEFSMNDAATMSVEQSAENLETMIQEIARSATKPTEVVILIMNSVAGAALEARPNLPAYNVAWREVAARYNLLVADTYTVWSNMQGRATWHWNQLIPDGIHPNAAGSVEVTLPIVEAVLGVH